MKFSIVIPTLNAENYIKDLILMLKRQTLPPSKIIVIDSSSRDRTVEIAAEIGCETVTIDREAFDHGGTRNLGAELSSGDVLVFMTQDALPVDDRFLENLVKPLANRTDPLIAASFGRQMARNDAVPPEKFARLFNYPCTGFVKSKDDISRLGIKAFFFSDVCSAVRRKEFEEVGRFPEKVIMNEDMTLAAKLILRGYKIAYVPEAAVWHSHNYSLIQQFRRYFDIGVSLKMNEWLLDYVKAEGEGYKFAKEQFIYLLKSRDYFWLPYTLGLTLTKYAGYKLGLAEDRLPLKLKRHLSLHRGFWK